MNIPSLFILFGFYHLSDGADFIPFFSEFFRLKNVRTIWDVSCSTNNIKTLAEWRKNSMDIISLQSISSRSALTSMSDFDPTEMIGLSIDLSCDSTLIIKKLPTEDSIKRKTVVIMWSNDYTKGVISYLLYSDFTNVFLVIPTMDESDKLLIYNGNMDLVMIWCGQDGLLILDTASRPTLSGKIVRGMITLKDKMRHDSNKLLDILERSSWETVNDNLMKFSFALHKFLEKMYDFRWQLHLSGAQAMDEVYVSRNGSLDYFMDGSQFGALKTGYVDVGLYPTELLASGLDSFELLQPLTRFRQFFVFSSPITALEPHMVYSMFSGKVWVVTILLTFLMAMVSTISAQNTTSSDLHDKEFTIITNVLITVGAVAQQGLERSSERLSVRISHFFLLFLTLLIFMFYSTGFLIYTLNPNQREIKSFEELLRKGYGVSAEDTPYNKFQLQGNYSHPSEWFYHNCEKGWGSCKTDVLFHNLSVGAEKVKRGKVAFFSYVSNIYGVLEDITTDREQSDLRELPVHKPYLVGTFVRKHFPYKELFSRGLLLLKETGIAFHEDRKWNFKKPDPLVDSYFVIASLHSTSVSFILLFCGILGSVIILVLEIFTKQGNLALKLAKFGIEIKYDSSKSRLITFFQACNTPSVLSNPYYVL